MRVGIIMSRGRLAFIFDDVTEIVLGSRLPTGCHCDGSERLKPQVSWGGDFIRFGMEPSIGDAETDISTGDTETK